MKSAPANGVRAEALLRGGIGLVGLMVGLFRLIRRVRAREDGPRGIIEPIVVMGRSAAWLALHLPLLQLGTVGLGEMIETYRSGRCQVTEGVVHVRHRQPANGHSSGDKIWIGKQSFEVDYFLATPGYNQTISHGGALRKGVYARLYHDHGVILKVEVAAKPPAP